MKKFLAILLTGISLCMLSGCDAACRTNLPEYESGYFRYAVETLTNKRKKAYLVGLTENGAEQKALIYPEEIDGITVYSLGYVHGFGGWDILEGKIRSEKLEKLYFPTMPKEALGVNDTPISSLNAYMVFWNLNGHVRYFEQIKGAIFGYNFIEEGYDKNHYSNVLIANVSYIYNFEDAPNKGYYWVDSYNETTIDFIPPNPTREGYKFDGWYKESECKTKWNFEIDMTGKEISFKECIEAGTYDGNYLYAKWITE